MSTASQGRAREHRVSKSMAFGAWVQIARSAGSKGPADLIMAHPTKGVALVQVGTNNKTLGPAERQRLLEAALLCHALPVVAMVRPRAGIEYHLVVDGPASTWPRWTP